jgi:hypothetical protein
MSSDSKVTSLESAVPAVAAKAKAEKSVAAKASGHDTALSGDSVELHIYASEKEHGSNAVEVGLNGVMYLVPRGQFFTVPVELVEVLRNAVTTVTTANPAGGGVVEREVPRFNFQTR